MSTISSQTAFSFAELKDKWFKLLEDSLLNNVFLTPQFQKTWWQVFGRGELCLWQIKNEAGELMGVAPLFLDESNLSFLGDRTVSDYLDFIPKKDNEKVFYELLSEKLETKNWQMLKLISIPEKSLTLSLFTEVAKARNWSVDVKQQDVCPVISLPKTWEEYLQMIGKKQRHEVKRKWKNLEEQLNPQFKVISSAENLDQDLKDFIKLHKLSSPEKATFWDEQHVKYFSNIMKAAAENNWLKLFFMEIAGQRSATMLCFDYNNKFYLYNSGYNPQFVNSSIGNVLTSYTIKTAIELGRTHFDFLRGDEEYKFRYGAVAEPVFDLTITR